MTDTPQQHVEAWKVYCKIYPEPKTKKYWTHFLAGWLAKAKNMQDRRRRGV